MNRTLAKARSVANRSLGRSLPTTQSRQRGLDQRILAYNPAARAHLVWVIGTGLIAAAAVVAQAWFLSVVISRVFLEQQALDQLMAPLAILLAIAIVRAAAVLAGDVLAQRSASLLKAQLRSALLSKLSALGPAYSTREHSGELASLAGQGVEELDEYIVAYQPLRFLAVLVPVMVALAVLVIDPLSVLVLLFTGPVLVLFLVLIGSRARELTDRRFQELNWMSAHFLDFLQGIATLKMFGRSREQVENIREISRRYGDTTLDVLRTAFETSFVLELSTTIATALVAVEIGLRLFDGQLPFQQALAVLIITPEFFLPVRQLAARYHAGAAGKTAAERIFAVLDAPLPSSVVTLDTRTPARSPRSGIVFENVWFAYERGERPVLRDLSFFMPRGKTVAIVGETGAGKSTIASLLLRFIEPQSGFITVDGKPLASIDVQTWRAGIAWVPQRPHLFFGSVADNIRLARPAATDAEVISAAEAACADTFIRLLPNGYDTQIGEGGARLSGGEQQRLAIARAYLKDAPLLILDEPTSHLDVANEALVQAALAELLLGKTALIISHRLNFAYQADQVVVLREGRIVEAGSGAQFAAREDGSHMQLSKRGEVSAS